MTVLDNTPRDQYTATASQTVFPYTFEIAAIGDIKVLQNGVLINQGAGAGEYGVSGVGVDTGGNVTLVTGATAGDVLTLYRDMALNRLTSYNNAGDFLAADVNNDFDRLWLALQQNTGNIDRALVAPDSDPTNIDMTIPDKAARLDKLLKFNVTTGNPEVISAADALLTGGFNVYNFTGTGVAVAFTLGQAPGGENNTQVYIDGVYQQKDTYSVSSTTLTFSTAPPNLSTIEVMVIDAYEIGSTTAAQVSFTQSGSTYGRNVQLKLQESISVLDFGAIGDGVTDDTVAIQAAIDYLKTGNNIGGEIFFPRGTYIISSTLVLNAPGITLIGESMGGQWNIANARGSFIKYVTVDTNPAIQITEGSSGTGYGWGCNLKNLQIETASSYGIQLGNADGSPVSWWGIIDNVYVTGATIAGVRFYGAQEGVLRKVHAENNAIGFLFDKISGGGVYPNSAVHLNSCRGYSNSQEGIRINQGENLLFTSCVWESNGYEGVNVVNDADGEVTTLTFNGCWVEDNQKNAGRLNGYYNVKIAEGSMLFDGFEFGSVNNKWDGVSGNKQLYVGNARAAIHGGRLTTTGFTLPIVDIASGGILHSMNPAASVTQGLFNVTGTGRLFQANKLFHRNSVPDVASGAWTPGDFVLRNGASSIDVGGVYGWICNSAGTPGTWTELGAGRKIFKIANASASLYTVSQYDEIVEVDATSAPVTVRLPLIGLTGKRYTIRKKDSSANAVTVAPQSGETANGSGTFSLATQYKTVTVYDNGTEWSVESSY